ncbi:MAG TPA: hypothetical protein VGR08_06590 [Thermomicrobiales bacterium]|nr:hypothetical protein [Thermomicrobiales bacterium]
MTSAQGRSRNHSPVRHRLAPYVPWTEATGRRWRGWMRLPLMAPFALGYIAASYAVFIPAAERRNGKYWIDEEAVGHLLLHIPDLSRDLPQAIRSLVIAPWLNHDSLQLIYVTALLLIFGIIFEVREGTLRAIAIFFGTTFVSTVVAGAILHAIYPNVWDIWVLENAWHRSWSGGSAGCFGLMGAIAGRTRRPGLLLAIFILWEAFIWWVNLRNYTSVFHLSALAAGFIATRYLLPPRHREPTA